MPRPAASSATQPHAAPGASVEVPRLVKGHGTQNDFVLFCDPEGRHDLSPVTVAALCDRRAGVGGDGLIRAVPTALMPGAAPMADTATWFMDYRNSDGSIAEMCGNGVRVFVAFLISEGLVSPAIGEEVMVATRAGIKRVRLVPGPGGDGHGDATTTWYAVGMGAWRLESGTEGAASGNDALVHLPHLRVALPGLRVDVGNPHVVVALPEDVDLDAVDLTHAPSVEPVPADGINVEIVRFAAVNAAEGHLRMRVHERGSGETRSCGTGAVATVLAARAWLGEGAPTTWTVTVPGGRLRIALPAGTARDSGDDVELAGPAVLLGDVRLRPDWWAHVTS